MKLSREELKNLIKETISEAKPAEAAATPQRHIIDDLLDCPHCRAKLMDYLKENIKLPSAENLITHCEGPLCDLIDKRIKATAPAAPPPRKPVWGDLNYVGSWPQWLREQAEAKKT